MTASRIVQIRLIVRAQRAAALFQRLVAESWVSDLSAEEVRGVGRQREDEHAQGEIELPRVSMTCVIAEVDVDRLAELSCTVCRTGRIGDGKMLVLPIADGIDIG